MRVRAKGPARDCSALSTCWRRNEPIDGGRRQDLAQCAPLFSVADSEFSFSFLRIEGCNPIQLSKTCQGEFSSFSNRLPIARHHNRNRQPVSSLKICRVSIPKHVLDFTSPVGARRAAVQARHAFLDKVVTAPFTIPATNPECLKEA
jgi:hypothetical protein